MDLRKESNKYESKQSLKLCTAIDDAQELNEGFELKGDKSLIDLNTKIDKEVSRYLISIILIIG